MARRSRPSKRAPSRAARSEPSGGAVLRVVGGKFRGSKLEHHGDLVTRPMKDRTREAVFNLLGPQVKGAYAVDLFAGTGALAIEAISRGAAGATLCERHFPTAKVIDRNLAALELTAICDVQRGDTFHFSREPVIDAPAPWIIFCSPPYDLFVDRRDDMLDLITGWLDRSPPGSQLVVESDARFDTDDLPQSERWDVREYPPARVAILEVAEEQDAGQG